MAGDLGFFQVEHRLLDSTCQIDASRLGTRFNWFGSTMVYECAFLIGTCLILNELDKF